MALHRPALLLALVLGACAQAPTSSQAPASGYAPPPPAAAAPAVEALTDGKGMTLYVFDRDVVGSGKSACNGPCAANWPPLVAGPDSSAFGQYAIVARDDGIRQWAYKGRPLYLWSKDQKPGDRTGDNVNNVWHVATP
jgi:predicted lipoprotein with Yx(FWY)xxD motif